MMRRKHPARRACVGAFARYMLPRWPTVEIVATILDDTDATANYLTAYTGRDHTRGQLVGVEVRAPWPGPDPRGPERESYKMVWDYDDGRWVQSTERQPCILRTVLYTVDAHSPYVLDQHAQIAAVRLARELARGYAIVQEGPAKAEVFGNQLQLAQFAGGYPLGGTLGDWIVVGWINAGEAQPGSVWDSRSTLLFAPVANVLASGTSASESC